MFSRSQCQIRKIRNRADREYLKNSKKGLFNLFIVARRFDDSRNLHFILEDIMLTKKPFSQATVPNIEQSQKNAYQFYSKRLDDSIKNDSDKIIFNDNMFGLDIISPC
jgi:hypothetical protein